MRETLHKQIRREAAAASRRKPLQTVQYMAVSLFCALEEDQGYAYFSDGEGMGRNEDRAEFIASVRRKLQHAREVVKIYNKFLRQNGA
jgi:hypothetical protein